MKLFAHLRSTAFSYVLVSRPALLGLAALLGSAFTQPAQAAQPAAPEAQQAVQLTQVDANSVRVRAYSPDRKPIRLEVVQVKDGTCNYLLSEVHRVDAYGTLLKFNTLSAGRYVVYVKAGANRRRCVVEVKGNTPDANTITVRETGPSRTSQAPATVSL